ncbi:MAG: YegS/Rv2252/BmrU family lipid kinase [Oscillospiraceae bacterium]|nr:YegS/Rv2252/BmrU family lipid kinase [Oscillospiraceae bacterium]
MSKLLFIFNPLSGKGLIKHHLLDIIDIFTKAGYDVTVRPTQSHLDAYVYIRTHGSEFDRIVVSGGDGTLNEGVEGLMSFPREERKPIGYIPAGTTNDFASTLNIPKDMELSAMIAASGVPFECDIGDFNGKKFTYIAAFGAFTDVSYDTPQEIKNVIGHAAYVWEGIKRLPSLSSYHVNIKYDGGEIDEEVFLCVIMNTTSVGGILSTEKFTDVNLCDGLFEMIVFRQPTNPLELQSVLSGIIKGEASGEGYSLVKSTRFEIASDESIKWTLDGEYGGEIRNAVINVLPRAISFIVDNNATLQAMNEPQTD